MNGNEDKIDVFLKGLDQYYPGSKRKRKSSSFPTIEKKEVELWENQGKSKKLPNGKTIDLFGPGSLCLAINRPIVTLRLWERKGYIPKAPYRLKSIIVDGKPMPGSRMYSRAMIESLLKSFQSRGLLETPRIDWNRHPDLSIELLENWTKIHTEETN
jgi:hypothetical protein